MQKDSKKDILLYQCDIMAIEEMKFENDSWSHFEYIMFADLNSIYHSVMHWRNEANLQTYSYRSVMVSNILSSLQRKLLTKADRN